jgi:hypothetical protein
MYRALIGVGAACGIAGMAIGAFSEKRSMRTPYPVGDRSNRLDWSSAGSSIVVKPIYIFCSKVRNLRRFLNHCRPPRRCRPSRQIR